MAKLFFECPVSAPLEQVRDGFNIDLFKALKPPLVNLEVKRFDGCKKGDEVHLSISPGIIPGPTLNWVSHITADNEDQDEWSFIDEGAVLPFPLKSWHHHHRVVRSANGSKIIDDITFSTGNSILDALVKPGLFLQFVGRKPVYQKFFGSPQ